MTWNGSIADGASVTITITAAITSGGRISNRGTANIDFDNNGTNETAQQTDNPATSGPDATTFDALGGPNAPALSPLMLMLLVATIAWVALRRM